MPTLDDLATRVDELERRLRSAEDVLAIQNLKSRYGALADARYGPDGPRDDATLARLADQIAALFSEDAFWDGGAGLGSCCGRAAIRARFLEPTLRFSWHYFVKPRIEVDGDRARARWDMLALFTSPKGEPTWLAGIEDDEYVRAGEGWLHASMRLHTITVAPHARGWSRVSPPEPG